MTARIHTILRAKWMGPWLIVGLAALTYVSVILARHGGDPLSFVQLGTQFTDSDPAGTEGYDGQFAYQIARNPVGASPYIDVPAYRYQRILYPLLARLLAFGSPGLIPWALILINILALIGGTRLTERLLEHYGASRWFALTYGLYAGQLFSLRLDLSEPLSQALIMLGILLDERRRWVAAAAAFALAVLSKETALVFVAGYVAFFLLRRRWSNLFLFSLVSTLPYVALQLLLRRWLGEWGVGSGGAGATGFEIVPFGGIIKIAQHSWEVLALWLVILGPLLVAPIVLSTVGGVRALLQGYAHPVTLALLGNCAMLMFLPFSTWREMLAVLRLSIGFVVCLVLFGALRGSRRTLLYSQLWIITVVFLFKE